MTEAGDFMRCSKCGHLEAKQLPEIATRMITMEKIKRVVEEVVDNEMRANDER